MENELALWLYGDLVATVSRETSGKVRLRYSDAALSTFELGMPLLSIGLPLADVSYPNARTRAFCGDPSQKASSDVSLPNSSISVRTTPSDSFESSDEIVQERSSFNLETNQHPHLRRPSPHDH